MQPTISLLGCLHCRIRQSKRDTWHINLSACACLYFITTSTYLLAHHNPARAALNLHMKHTLPILPILIYRKEIKWTQYRHYKLCVKI